MKEPIGIDAYHLFCFRLLVITIKKHGGINGHIRSYNCWRGRPETLCRGTATGTCLCHGVTYLQPGLVTTPGIKNSSKSNQPLISVFQDAKQDDISAHFQSFGELDNINLKTDPATGRSRWKNIQLCPESHFDNFSLLQRVRVRGV